MTVAANASQTRAFTEPECSHTPELAPAQTVKQDAERAAMSDVRQGVTAGRAGPLCRLRRRNYGARIGARQIAAKKKSGPSGPE